MIDVVREGCLTEEVCLGGKKKSLAAAEKGIGRKKMIERSEGWWSNR